MAASNTRFTQNSLGQSKNPIDSDHGIYRDHLDWAKRRPALASRSDGISHLLVLQQLDVIFWSTTRCRRCAAWPRGRDRAVGRG